MTVLERKRGTSKDYPPVARFSRLDHSRWTSNLDLITASPLSHTMRFGGSCNTSSLAFSDPPPPLLLLLFFRETEGEMFLFLPNLPWDGLSSAAVACRKEDGRETLSPQPPFLGPTRIPIRGNLSSHRRLIEPTPILLLLSAPLLILIFILFFVDHALVLLLVSTVS